MVAYEIEAGVVACGRDDDTWGYVIHRHEVGRGYGPVYLGECWSGSGYGSYEEAFEAGRSELDERHGEGGWSFL